MTIRKTRTHEGKIEVVEEPIHNPYLRILLGTNGWKLIVIFLIATMHPVGRGLLSSLGFEFQDTKKITVAAEEAKLSKTELVTISDSIKDIKADVSSLKANNAILNSKVDNMEQTFRGFQIDWNKWRVPMLTPEPKQP